MDECKRTEEKLTPYVDEALVPAERAEVERHLNACPPCRQDAVEEQGGRTVLRGCAERLRAQPLPPGLRTRCEALARGQGAASTSPWWRPRIVPATLGGALTLFTGLALFALATRQSDALLAAQLTADHVKCFKFVPRNAQSADAQQVEEALESQFGWDMHVPPSSPDEGVRLLAGRRCLYADGRVPHLMYQAAGAEPVSLFRLEGLSRPEGDLNTLGHRCRIWSRDGNTYVLVGPESSPAWTRIARYVEREAR